MRITHYNLTTTTKEGGVETFVWDLAAAQAAQGHTVTVVGGVGPIRRPAPGISVRTAPFVDRARFAIGPLRRAYAWRKLAERLSLAPAALPLLADADLVHIHKPYDLALGPWLRARGVPLVYHGHGEDFFRGDTALMRFASVLLSCSAYNARTLQARYGRAATVVYNGVDVAAFSPAVPADPALRRQLAGTAATLLLLPGRLMPWKDHATVLEALSLLDDPSVALAVIGDGETRQALERQAAALGLAERVVFTGTVPHEAMPRYLAVGDLVIGASYVSETFGMLLAEALACGRPVVASSWQGYDDVVLDGTTGRRFTAQDPAALAAVLRELIADPAERARLAAQGRERVAELFAWPKIAERVAAAYPPPRPPR